MTYVIRRDATGISILGSSSSRSAAVSMLLEIEARKKADDKREYFISNRVGLRCLECAN